MSQSTFREIMIAVRNYFENKCNYCDTLEDLHIHHILPLSRGGKSIFGNMELVCGDCHNKLHIQLRKVLPLKIVPIERQCVRCGRTRIRKTKLQEETMCPRCVVVNKKLIRKNVRAKSTI